MLSAAFARGTNAILPSKQRSKEMREAYVPTAAGAAVQAYEDDGFPVSPRCDDVASQTGGSLDSSQIWDGFEDDTSSAEVTQPSSVTNLSPLSDLNGTEHQLDERRHHLTDAMISHSPHGPSITHCFSLPSSGRSGQCCADDELKSSSMSIPAPEAEPLGGVMVRSLSRPMLIPGNDLLGVRSATYQPSRGMLSRDFVPPHKLVAHDDELVVGSQRVRGMSFRGTTAQRIKSLVFEQTGLLSVNCAQSFLQS